MVLNKKIIGIGLVAALLIAGAAYALWPNQTEPSPTTSPAQNQSDTSPNSNSADTTKPVTKEPRDTSNNSNQTNDISVTITNISTDSAVTIRNIVEHNTGDCTYKFTGPGGVTITKTGSVKLAGTIYYCSPYSFAKADFTSGEWSVKLTVESNNARGSDTATFKVE